MARAVANENLDSTPPIDVMFGAYEVGRYRMPYMMSLLTAQQCLAFLSLASDDPELTLASGKVEELFQRDIDQERVAQMADHYLSPANAIQRPPFFNALTIALLHRGIGASTCPQKSPRDQYQRELQCGPVLVTWDESLEDQPNLPRPASFGCVYWNRHGVRAVAIDGQHRLAALQRLAARHPIEASKIRVSVLILLLDERFGVKADGRSQIEVMRTLFIDLNKHAQSVSRARQLLLDDTDPLAVCLRNCVGSELQYTPTNQQLHSLNVGRNGEFNTKVPLSLVDWHGEQRAKIDAGPYLVSVLGLEWALVNLCKSDRFGRRLANLQELSEDAELIRGDEEESQGYYESVRAKLGRWLDSIPQLSEEIAEAQTREIPFHPSIASIDKMGSQMAETWGPAITRIFTSTKPYRKLIDYALANQLLNGKFSAWYQAWHALETAAPAARTTLADALQSLEDQLNSQEPGQVAKYRGCRKAIEEQIKSVSDEGAEPEPHLLFSLTGQRALFLALRQIFDICNDQMFSDRKLAQELGLAPPQGPAEVARFLAGLLGDGVSYWDTQLGGKFFTKAARASKASGSTMPPQFWRGSLVKRESTETIDFSTIAAERTSRVICLLWSSWNYRRNRPDAPFKPIQDWLKNGSATELIPLEATASGAHLKKALLGYVGLDQFGAGGHEANKFPLAFLAKLSLDEETEMTREDFQKFAQHRVRWIWDCAKSE